ncbi:EamA family transporter [Acinetobacter sp. ANC 4558]|uniref:aromatic amino acid DMT transporter YddG n=1 Tax=Acinetobacter sp. ANC 4558 TaxID=1977876 RepID=UPI000A33AF1D|nr:aromatic amino acid DMT transporter YddG [Acinetobacter sp. ANC 4558]OTG86701.1 EamA family transporter [Acinetobacter sp. ANC 4558]
MNRQIATSIGILALLLWSTLVGLLRLSTEAFGPMYTVTYVYTLSAVILYFSYGLPDFKKISKKFLIISSLLFIIFELCFAFSITLAPSAEKSIEMNITFSLWPTLIILMLAFLKEEKVNFLTIIGILISFSGIVIINYHPNLNFIDNFYQNPISYLLIFLAALLWAVYCIYTKKYSNGTNAISLYFILTASALWILTISIQGINFPYVNSMTSYLFILIGAFFFAMGYLAWNVGIIKGNMPVLVMLSYFSPLLSSSFSVLVLHSSLSSNFWYGAITVTVGSFICWLSIRKKSVQQTKLAT